MIIKYLFQKKRAENASIIITSSPERNSAKVLVNMVGDIRPDYEF